MNGKLSGYALKRKQSRKTLRGGDERVQGTRHAIVMAARDVLLESGYAAARVEDIVTRAGISRPTFYRHFKDKFEVAAAYNDFSRGETMVPWKALAGIDFRDEGAVRDWLENLFSAFEAKRDELVIWAEMSAVEPDYLLRVPRFVPGLIEELGQEIPAFRRASADSLGYRAGNLDSAEPGPVWIEICLLLEDIFQRCISLAMGSSLVPKQQSTTHYAARLSRFIREHDA